MQLAALQVLGTLDSPIGEVAAADARSVRPLKGPLVVLTELRRVLEAKLARPVSPKKEVWLLDTGPWWRLFRDHRGLDEAKVAILEAAWRLPLPLFLLPEKPLAQELEPFLRREATAWQIDRSKSAEAFYSTEPASGLGNWQLYAAKRPLTAPVPNKRIPRRHGLVYSSSGADFHPVSGLISACSCRAL